MKEDVKYLLLIFILALLISSFFIFKTASPIVGDSSRYDHLALNLVKGNGYSASVSAPYLPEMLRPPLYPLFLCVIYFVFGHNLIMVQFFQALMYASISIVVFFIAKDIFDRRTAYVSSFLVSSYPSLSYYASVILTEILTAFLLSITILLSVKAIQRKSVGLYALAGFLLGLTTLTRGNTLLLPLFLFPGIYLIYENKKHALRDFAIFLVAMFLLIIPWTVRNYLVTQRFVPLVIQNGSNLWAATMESKIKNPAEVDKIYKDPIMFAAIESTDFRQVIIADNILFGMAMKNIKSDTLGFFYFCLRNIPKRWVEVYVPRYKIGTLFLAIFGVTILILTFYGIMVSLKIWREALPLFIIIIYYSIIHAPLVSTARYSIPARPYLLIFVAIGLLKLYDFFCDSLLNDKRKIKRSKISK